jgi:hypothetical protein
MRQSSVGPIRKLDFVTIGQLKLFQLCRQSSVGSIGELIFVTIGELKLFPAMQAKFCRTNQKAYFCLHRRVKVVLSYLGKVL